MRLLRFFKRELSRDIEQWVSDGLVTTDQAVDICARYDMVYGEHNGKSRAYAILMSLGFLFIGLAVITLLGANWEQIPRIARTAGLFLATLIANISAARLYLNGQRATAIGVFVLGSILYGASIMLIGQMYHLGVHFADGIAWWALGVLPIALLTRSNTLMFITVALATIWAFVTIGIGYFPTAAIVFIAALALHLRINQHSLVLFLALIAGACSYLQLALSQWLGADRVLEFGAENLLTGFALAAVLFGLSRWLLSCEALKRQDYGTLLDVWLLRGAIVTLFVFSFSESWKELFDATFEQPILTLSVIAALAGLAIGIASLQQTSSHSLTGRHLWATISVSLIVVAISALAIFAPASSHTTLFAVATNIAILALGIYLISRGLVDRVTHYFFTGVATVLGLAVIRYFDLIGDYIGATALFIVCALVLLGVAAVWKRAQQVEVNAA